METEKQCLTEADVGGHGAARVFGIFRLKLSATAWNVIWVLFTQGGLRLLTAIRGIVLARLLHPMDFGIVAVAMMLHDMIQQFGEMGIGSAAVHFQKRSEEVLPVAFVMKCIFSILLTIAIFVFAPVWGTLFDGSEVVSATRFTGLFALVSIFGFPAYVIAQINLRFKDLALPTLVATLMGCIVAVGLALMGVGYWSIVWGILAHRVVEAVLLIRAFPWKVKFTWNTDVARGLWKYGFHMVAAASLYFLIVQVDKMAVGKLLGLTALGYYAVAFRWAEFGSRDIVSGIGSVLFPTFSSWHAAGIDSAEKIERIMQISAVLYFPISVGLMLVANEFVSVVLGDRWLPAVLPMQVLCVAVILRSIGHPIGKFLQASGHPELEVRINLGFLVTLTVLIAPAALWLGLVGAGASVLVSAFVWYLLVRVIQLRRVANLGFAVVARALLPSLLASAVMAAGILIVKSIHIGNTPGIGFLALLIVVGVVLYIATIFALLGKDFRVYLGLSAGPAIS